MIACAVAVLVVAAAQLLFTAPAVVSASGFETPATAALAACDALRNGTHLEVKDAANNGPFYTSLANAHTSTTARGSPACIVSPRDSAEVATAVKTLAALNITFAIRSGGHSPHPGWANVDGNGVLVSLDELRRIKYSAATTLVKVEAGARWGAVYELLAPRGRIPLGPRAGTVGVGGFMLGGGLSHFAREYGLAVNSVVGIEVVTANGTIMKADTTANPDLFWALKGGANNFGIVTSYILNTFSIGQQVWGGAILYDMSRYAQLTKAIYTYHSTMPPPEFNESVTAIMPYFLTNANLIIVTYFCSKPTPYPNQLAPFWAVEKSADYTAVQSYDKILNVIVDRQGIDRWAWTHVAIRMNAIAYNQTMDIIRREGDTLAPQTSGAVMLAMVQPIYENLASFQASSTSGSPLSISATRQICTALSHNILCVSSVHFTANHSRSLGLNLNVGWTDPGDDATARRVLDQTTTKVRMAMEDQGNFEPFIYPNDVGPGQNATRAYAEKNWKELKDIAAKYDPKQVFQRLVPGGFKLNATGDV